MEQTACTTSPELPKFQPIGPTVFDDIDRAIQRYGLEAVKHAVKTRAKRKIGRTQDNDWPIIYPNLSEDAKIWLEGRDPTKVKSNYSIAKLISEAHPGQSVVATHKKIARKLKKWRKILYLGEAVSLSLDFPYPLHIKALRELTEHGLASEIYKKMADEAEKALADYTSMREPPPQDWTIVQVRAAANEAWFNDVKQPSENPINALGWLIRK